MARTKVDKEKEDEAIKKAISIDPFIADLKRPWQKFFAKFHEIDEIKVSQWKEVHILAYISKRFQTLYNKKFSITVKGAPSKSQDIYLIKQIIATVGTTNMRTIKEYVDWVFDYKIIPNRMKIRTLAYFMTSGLANEFSFHKKEQTIIKRSTKLPDEYLRIANQLGLEANTYGDLAFIKMASDRKRDIENPYFQLMANLEAIGFEPIILEKLSE